MKKRKRAKVSFMWFWVFWLVEHAPKSVKHQFNKLGWLTTTDPKKVGKLILKWLFLTRSPALTMKQRALWAEEKEQKCLIFDFGCTVWQSTPQNLFKINLRNLVSSLQQTLRKEQKLCWSSPFYLRRKLSEKNKQHFESNKKNQNVLYVIFGALVGRARHEICKISIYQIFFDAWKRSYGKANIILKLIFAIQKRVLRKNQRTLSSKDYSQKVLNLILDALFGRARPIILKISILRKTARMSYDQFWVLWLAEHAPKSTQYRLNKFFRLTLKNISSGKKLFCS